MKKILAMTPVLILVAGLAAAATLAGVTMPDTAVVAGKTLDLNGQGLRTKFFFRIYVAGLYLGTRTHDPAAAVSSDEVKQIVMHFVYSHVTRQQMVDAWNDSFGQESLSPETKKDVSLFNSWMGDISAGEQIVLTYEPGKGTTVEFAGKLKGTIPGKDFMEALWRVWLGDHPPSSSMKKGMLGL